MIVAENINKSFGNLHVLKGIDLQIAEGEIVSIVGASGAGKSTLLHILGTLDVADQGNVWIEGKKVNQLNEKELSNFRNKISVLYFNFIICYPNSQLLKMFVFRHS